MGTSTEIEEDSISGFSGSGFQVSGFGSDLVEIFDDLAQLVVLPVLRRRRQRLLVFIHYLLFIIYHLIFNIQHFPFFISIHHLPFPTIHYLPFYYHYSVSTIVSFNRRTAGPSAPWLTPARCCEFYS